LSLQSLREHADLEGVIRIHVGLLSPLIVEQMLMIEADELTEQAPIGLIRCRLDLEIRGAEVLGKIVKTHGHLTHYGEGPAAAAFQRPEQIGIGPGIREADLPVGRDDFGFEQAPCGGAIMLRVTAKAPALDQTRNPYGRASASLNVLPIFCRNRLVGLHPARASA